MRLDTFITSITFLTVFPGTWLVSATAIDNDKVAHTLLNAAVKLSSGNYQIKNVQTGHSLHYTHGSAYNLYPTSAAGTEITLKAHGGVNNLMRFSVGEQCGSAQWTYGGGGYDVAMVLYACVGTSKATGTLNTNKQKWLVVPTKSKLKRSHGDRLDSRHFSDVDSDFFDTEEETETIEDGDLAKRSTKLGPYYIIPYDHLYDMETRALSSSAINTPGSGGDAKSTALKAWKKGNKAQEWYFYKQ